MLGPDFSNVCSALVLSNVVLLRVYKSALANDYIRYEPRVMQQWENIDPDAPIYFTGEPREEIDQNWHRLLNGKFIPCSLGFLLRD